jgi:2-iminobutanoate/2-iminopropanoate deaminase
VPLVALGFAGCATTLTKDVVSTKEELQPQSVLLTRCQVGNLLFLAGQVSIDPKTNQFNAGSIEDQTTLVLENLKAVVTAGGMTMADIVSTTVFLKDVNDFGKMNAVYATYFKDKPPARATIQVARLPRDALIEISAIAAR